MARFDVDVFGVGTYGPGAIVPFLADPVTGASKPEGPAGLQCRAVSTHTVDVFWASTPASSTTAHLTMTRLVRSLTGPPSWETDGTVLVDAPIGSLLRYTDTGLQPDTYYYYTLFFFDATVQTWLRAGSTSCITPSDQYDMGSRLFELLPMWYQQLDDDPNPGAGPLRRFLALLGYELTLLRTEINSLTRIWDMKRGNAQAVPYALGQFLLEPEPELGYGNQRQLMRAALQLYALKGSATCIAQLCSSVTGWATTIYRGANLVVDNLDAQFDGSTGRWNASNATVTWRAGDSTINAPNGRGMAVLTATSTTPPMMTLYADDPRYSGIPVTAGLVYGASALIRGSAGDTVTIAVQYWDASGTAIGSPVVGTGVVPDGADWAKQVIVVSTAPAIAWSMSLQVATNGIVSGHITYVSSVMVNQLATLATPIPAYQPARDVRVVVRADQINEVPNPRFATDTNSWSTAIGADVTATGGVLTRIQSTDQPPPITNTFMCQLAATAVGQGTWIACTECTAESYYTASLWVKVMSGAGVQLVLRDHTTAHVARSIRLTDGVWTDGYASLVSGLTTTELDLSLVALGATTVRFGAVLCTQGGPEVAYFDGSIASPTADYMWENGADASRSHFYRQRTLRSYRFRELLPKFMVTGQTATLLFAQGNMSIPADPVLTP